MAKVGLFLGKFMPAHKGHELVIKFATARCDTLHVVVGTQPGDTLDPLERYQNIKQIAAGPSVYVHHLHKTLPQYPSEAPNTFWSIWKVVLQGIVGTKIDYVFGSDPYILTLAEVLGAEPILVDPNRECIPTSATQLRSSSYADAIAYIPEALKQKYKPTVTVIGPESTGKSTMVTNLAKDFRERFIVNEYGRTYDEAKKTPWEHSDFANIIARQRSLHSAVHSMTSRITFQDTDAFQTEIWKAALIDNWLAPSAIHSVNTNNSYYILLAPTTPFVDDGTRYHSIQEDRNKFFNLLYEPLVNSSANYCVLKSSDFKLRQQQATTYVDHILNSSISGYT